jgi:two-component system sensor histidine kinase AlgZ
MKDETPLLVPVLAALPVCTCMIILSMPAIGHGYAPAFRALYFVACMAWTVPLTLLQRALWRRASSWLTMALALLAASYPMSVVNALLAQRLAVTLGVDTRMHLDKLLQGLDGCWLPLIAFCAIHAVAVYYLAYQRGELRLAQALAAARDAELRALRYQINPHFLFNTLNAISALVSADANRDANRMLARVADFLRASLAHDDSHEHALADELALTEAYLDIEKVRLGERLLVTMKVGPDVLDAPVPYLLLQPLVENAIRHGIAPSAETGCVDIRVDRDGALLRVEVLNDGAEPAHANSTGIGLANVTARLRQLYGAAQSVDAGWRADGRFQVLIALPMPLRSAGLAA